MRRDPAGWRSLARRAGGRVASIAGALIERRERWLPPALLACATLLSFLPTLENGFVGDWDDDVNLVNNPSYRGLGWAHLRWMFTTFLAGHYMPLTWLTFGLDYLAWGMSPVGYHLTNLLLHMASAVAFYLIAVRLLEAARPTDGDGVAVRLGAALAGVLFAVHPLRAESVAWATERRDVLCGLFYLLAVLAYLRACDGRAGQSPWRRWSYWAALGLGACALLSKSMAVSLPIVLLALDVYPLGRLGGGTGWLGQAARRVWAEKVPFVVLSEVAGVMALTALAHDKGLTSVAKLGLVDRVAISLYALAFYLWKMLVPMNLSPMYELPARIDPLSWPYLAAAAVVAGLSAAALLRRRRWPGLAAVWASYVVILLPVLGIVQNGWQIAADRYTYLAGLGWALLAGGGLRAWCAAKRRGRVHTRRWAVLAVVVIAVGLGTLTWRQVHVWHDLRSLWTRAVDTYPSVTAHYNLAVFLFREGDTAGAITNYRRALAIKPDFAEAHNNLGVALAREGRLDEAVQQFEEALKIAPDGLEAHYGLGLALMRQGRQREAADHFRRALSIRPGFQDAQRNLDRALAESRLAK
jgi:protein O-mannosyl-transferase